MIVKAFGTYAADKPLERLAIPRREIGAQDVQIDITYCGICHSDLHQARAEWEGTKWPCVPGHEMVGRVSGVGQDVTRFNEGDLVGVGVIVDSCRNCFECDDGQESYCDHMVGAYNGPTADEPGHTLGGYSQKIVVNQRYVLKITHQEDQLAAVAPLLCAGITTYSPLKHWGAGPGKKVGVVGIGGLGHVGVKIARALGAHVVAFTTSESKRADATALGAHEVVNSRDPQQMQTHDKSFDLIINTVAAAHDLDPFSSLLKRDATMVLVGAPATRHPSPSIPLLIGKRRSLAGSQIGGIPETQEMLDFCARNNIVADIELIGIDDVNTAYERLEKGDVKYRFVIDNQSLN